MRNACVYIVVAVILFAMCGICNNAGAQVLIPVLDKDVSVRSIKELSGADWIATDVGAYRVEGNGFRRIPDKDLNVSSIEEVGGAVWIVTDAGAYRVEGNEARRIPDKDLNVTSIEEVGGAVWILTYRQGVYRVEGNDARRIPDKDLNVFSIEEVGGVVWIQTFGQGVYRVEGNDARGIPEKGFSYITSVEEVAGAVWITSNAGAYRMEGNEALRIPDKDLNVKWIRELGGAVWIRTERQGMYRVEGNEALRIPDKDLSFPSEEEAGGSIKELSGAVWMSTTQGAYRVEGNDARRIPDKDLHVKRIRELGGAVWILTYSNGAYRVEGNEARRIPDKWVDVQSIRELGGAIWLETPYNVAFRVEGNDARRIPDNDLKVRSIGEVGGAVWILTYNGVAYRVEGTETRRIPDKDVKVRSIKEFSGAVWIATDVGAYRVEGTESRRIPDKDLNVVSIEEFGGAVWIVTDAGAYRVEGNEARRIPDKDLQVSSIDEFGGAVWFGTDAGAYRVEGNEARRIPDKDLNVVSIEEVGGAVWIVTDAGAYRVEGNEARRIPVNDLKVRSIREVGGAVWITSDAGAYRVEQNATIWVEFADQSSWWKSLVQKVIPDTWISGPVTPRIYYHGLSSDAFIPPFGDEHFEIIVEMDKDKFDERLQQNKFNTPQEYYWRTGPLFVNVAVRDSWGNRIVLAPTRGWVVPEAQVLLVVIPVLFGLFLIAIIALAPVSDFCHGLLMNPILRAYGSFGLIPLALTVLPPVRHHMMQRYFRGIRNDEEFAEWQDRYVVPSDEFLPENFTQRLIGRRRLLLLGRSGIGKTSLFRYLTGYFASKPKTTSLSRNVVPIFVPVSRYKGEKPITMVTAQLANFGKITDQRLAEWMIRNGGFLILFDGLNEIDEATRSLIIAFVDQHWKANYLCLSSQEEYAEFGQWKGKVELTTLDRDHVEELLRRRLGQENAETVIAEMTDELFAFCSLPQNLDLTIEVLLAGRALPRSGEALFAEIFAPRFEKWREGGSQDYPSILCERAYRMLRDRDPFVKTKDSHLPNEIVEFLLDKRLAVRRGTECHFRHDLIRAYLAALHFCSRWRELLDEEGLIVDENWRTLLEFTILRLNNAEKVQDLVYRLLELNAVLAKSLFQWMKSDHPHLCVDWKADFTRRYGEAMLAED